MAQDLNLFIDADNGRCVLGFTSTIPATIPPFKFGDKVPVNARVLTASDRSGGGPYKEYDLTGKEIRIGIGTPAGKPSAGEFTLTFDAETTDPIPYNATAQDVADALNELSAIITAGGVTVTSGAAGSYRVIFATAGDMADITADTAALYPSTGAYIAVAQAGDGSTREVVTIKLETMPAAYAALTTELPDASVDVTVVRAGASGVGEIQTIDLSEPEPYGGSYALTVDGHTTPAITYNATAEEVQEAIEAADASYAGLVTVTGGFPIYSVSFAASLAGIGEMTADVSALIVPEGRRGVLNLNTAGIVELLNGAESARAKLEIEIYDTGDSSSWTPIQQDVVVIEDVIPSSPASQTPMPEYLESGAMAGAAEKSTPVDGDHLPLLDSEAGGALKKLSWANLKLRLIAAFDSVYMGLTGAQTVSGSKTFASVPKSTGSLSGDATELPNVGQVKTQVDAGALRMARPPLVHWVLGIWSGSGTIPDRGLSADALTLFGGPSVASGTDGSVMIFDGAAQYATAPKAIWQRINDGLPFTLLMEGEDLAAIPPSGYTQLMGTSSAVVSSIGFHLLSRSNVGGQLFVETRKSSSIGDRNEMAVNCPVGTVVRKIAVASNGSTLRLRAVSSTGQIFSGSMTLSNDTSGAPTYDLVMNRNTSAANAWNAARIDSLRMWDAYIDPQLIF